LTRSNDAERQADPRIQTTSKGAASYSAKIFLTLFVFVDPKYLGREIVDPGVTGRGRFRGHNARLGR